DFVKGHKARQPVVKLVEFLRGKVKEIEFELEITKTLSTHDGSQRRSGDTQKNHSLKPIHDTKHSSANSDINSSQSRICVFCNGPHKSFLCDSTLSPMEREKIRRIEGLCHIYKTLIFLFSANKNH